MTSALLPGLFKTAVPLHPLQDLLWAASFYSRFFLSYVPFYGLTGALLLFVAVRYDQVWNGREWGGPTQAAGNPNRSPPPSDPLSSLLQNGDSRTASQGCGRIK